MKIITSLLLAAATMFTCSLGAFAATGGTVKSVEGLWLQNQRLLNDHQKVSSGYNSLSKTAYQELDKALKSYESAMSKAGDKMSPPFSGTGIYPPPMVTGLFSQVRFTVVDKNKKPLTNVHITAKAVDEDVASAMSSFTDPGYDSTTDHTGSTLRFMLGGEYNVRLLSYASGEEVEETFKVTIVPGSAPIQDVVLTWSGVTPEEDFKNTPDRVIFKVTDKNGKPVTGVVAKFFIPHNVVTRADNAIVIVPIEHLDKNGCYTIPSPSKPNGRLLLYSDNNQNRITGKGYAQTVDIKIPRLTGVCTINVIWDPEDTGVTSGVKFVNPKIPSFSSYSAAELSAKANELNKSNAELLASINSYRAKWNTLISDIDKKTTEGLRSIEAKYKKR